MDRSLETDYQYDVNLTLSSLLTTEMNGVKPFERIFAHMRGLVGPRVRGATAPVVAAIYWSIRPARSLLLGNLRQAHALRQGSPEIARQSAHLVLAGLHGPARGRGHSNQGAGRRSRSKSWPTPWASDLDALQARRAICYKWTHPQASIDSMRASLPPWTSMLRYELNGRRQAS